MEEGKNYKHGVHPAKDMSAWYASGVPWVATLPPPIGANPIPSDEDILEQQEAKLIADVEAALAGAMAQSPDDYLALVRQITNAMLRVEAVG